MGNKNESEKLRIAVMLDMTWPLRRHIDVFAGVAQYAAEQAGWTCVVDDFATDTIQESGKGQPPYDAVIARVTPQLAALAKRRNIPLVNVWFSSPVKDVPTVTTDSQKVGRLVAEHLLDRGIRTAVCLIRCGDRVEYDEAVAMQARMNDEGAACQIYRIAQRFAHSRAQWKKTYSLLQQWLDTTRLPAGLYAGVDILGRLVAQACADMGINVPRNLAIVAAHNEPTICEHPAPALTSLDIGFDRIGYEAARIMDELLKGEKPPTKPILIPPRQLIVRESSDFAYVEDAVVASAIHYIANHIRHPITVEDVAEAVDVSRRNLEKRFFASTHRTVAQEMRRIRLEQVKRLLAGNELSIKDIAKSAGYSSNAQMSRVFQRELGMSPREYRNTSQRD